ncbi:MAG: hypothetical protein NZ902_06125 [Acidilobaceae archaeon]|nr:hypothetical protein [Acidilobaceae archaeon]MDW7974785.1 hypothetical protein [Sulfolobales archaeon]
MQKERLVAFAALFVALVALGVALLPALAQSQVVPLSQFVQRIARIEVQAQAPTVQPVAMVYWFGNGYLNVSEIRVNFTNIGNARAEASVALFIRVDGRDISRFATVRLDPGENRQFTFNMPTGGVNLSQIRKIELVIQQSR